MYRVKSSRKAKKNFIKLMSVIITGLILTTNPKIEAYADTLLYVEESDDCEFNDAYEVEEVTPSEVQTSEEGESIIDTYIEEVPVTIIPESSTEPVIEYKEVIKTETIIEENAPVEKVEEAEKLSPSVKTEVERKFKKTTPPNEPKPIPNAPDIPKTGYDLKYILNKIEYLLLIASLSLGGIFALNKSDKKRTR